MSATSTAMTTPLGAFVEGERKRLKWTQRRLEDETGVSRTALQHIIDGRTQVPDLDTFRRLANALQTPIAYLMSLCGIDVGDSDRLLSPEQRQRLSRLTPEQRQEMIDLADRLWPSEGDPRP
jgi:transcriptional regulator with XRE-family HTH domain